MTRETFQPRKLFSLGEANQTLPLVTRIIDDIVRVNTEVLATHRRMQDAVKKGRSVEAQGQEDRLHDLDGEFCSFVEELESIGCLCKDPMLGLVDFPTRNDGRIVFFCWKKGEPEISFYHETHAGFAGRKPVGDLSGA